MAQSVEDVLKERGTRYGAFINQAGIAQGLHQVIEFGMQVTGKTRFDFYVDELEAINMIVNKLARIINGDPHYSDSWRDIAGYATLVADRLDNDNIKKQKLIEDKERASEQYERNRTPEQIEADRTDNEPNRPEGHRGLQEDTAVDQYHRPTGLSELRGLPVDGETTEADPGVRAFPGQ